MTGPRRITAGELADVDQAAAEVADMVALAAGHMAMCESVPAGLCVGTVVTAHIHGLCTHRVRVLLEEAVAQLARTAGPDEGGGP
jgi:hypothetical protein